MGHTDNGGSASAVAAPAANAIRLRRQPHDRTIEWAMRAKVTTSVPIPKFASLCGTLICELRNRRTLATC